MAKMFKSICMFLLAMIFIVAVAPQGEAAISCDTVASTMNACLPYLTDKGPIGSCCSGVKSLYSAASTPSDRQTVCNCLKSLAGSFAGVNPGKAGSLPGECGLNISYKFNPSVDCSKIN